MSNPSDSTESAERALVDRLAVLGRSLGEREAAYSDDLKRAEACAERLRARVSAGLEAFHAAAAEQGASHLQILLSDVRADDKHLRSVEFELIRGRHKAIVTAKSRGDVTLVGPFHIGKTEGPCLTFSFDTGSELDDALVTFLENFLEEAASP